MSILSADRKNVFVSSCATASPPAASLIERLREVGLKVVASPRGPSDERWPGWYAGGCREEIAGANIFIAVVTRGWDSSTWMAIESDEALRSLESGALSKMYFWNPERIEVKAAGVLPYLRDRLPDDLGELISMLEEV